MPHWKRRKSLACFLMAKRRPFDKQLNADSSAISASSQC
ncbi:hypothetical protein T03_9949 [Trichinella britovi]|uniref:Uncharacterized protein n=1 Tax=Trichinella britovi TaxID=45882 RepID=A0A0V1D9E0_TRIBR|nr:hypothetical protein T06_11675 [Trichinella sp. T6]KRY58004.1 hypothetical protein T03_9949 [Trichinella britovi]